ncbi:uncharacterized protein HMPREF1541_02618 [Cyphellophora europaea CBS 101466]|uniref:Uncharacterized protein n=1 Tax=Cyphellophora europaea (strain CBS 101466) TaxID=1220924 RepID=W2S6B3_CYPE1|nr:uncharacterized protein HMPREF1541_02618 [Cyphellophora europaea CBS 101466]ETN43459.1 hypothetical protein HMPREF1541_02618 [Cyphellophora europaea CBS 101466]
MSDNNFNVTAEDVRNLEAKEAKFHGGNPPSMAEGGDAAALKQMLSEQESKTEQIDRVKANLPLPDQPIGGASADLQSADQRTVNVGSGGVNAKLGTQSSSGLREPATADSSVRVDGEELKKPTQP